jgi:hypothetical protein
LSAPDVKRLHDALLKFPLASYQYNVPWASADTHLGFIIDDVEPSPSVARNGETVDLYGYTTMAVAAVQEQAREIDQLEREVASLRHELMASRVHRAKRRRVARRTLTPSGPIHTISEKVPVRRGYRESHSDASWPRGGAPLRAHHGATRSG